VYRLGSGNTMLVERVVRETRNAVVAAVLYGNLRDGYTREGILYDYERKKVRFSKKPWD
jgi:hypothetical protein